METIKTTKTGFARLSDENGKLLGMVTTAKRFGLDPTGGPWVAICEEHSTVCNFETNEAAISHLPLRDWCEECQANA